MKFSLGKSKIGLQVLLVSFVCFLCIQAFAADQAGMWRYTVRPGDYLITIGKKHLINPDDWKVVQRINEIKDPYRIPIGKVIYVPLEMVRQGPATAEVVFVSGQAQLQKSANNFETLQIGQKLSAGARIITKEKSKVVIKFADGTTTELASDSQLKLDTMSLYSGGAMVDTTLRLQKGRLKTNANPGHVKGNSIQVITPSAIAAVRGTKFRVSSSEKVTIQETLDGSVILGAANREITVDKGFGSKAELGKPPIPPTALLPAANTTDLKKQYETLPVVFDMPNMQGAASWVGEIVADTKLEQPIAEAETQGSRLVFSDVADGKYHLNFRAKDNNKIAGYDAVHQFTLNARPLQPAAISPATNSLIRKPYPVLQWGHIAEAQLYSVEIATDRAFKQIHEVVDVDTTEYRLSKGLVPGVYFWRVSSIAKNKHGLRDKGPAINISQFTYKSIPPKPDISQLKVEVSRNRVMVKTILPLNGLTYYASLDNEFNNQRQVWQGHGLDSEFDFLLREYGKQTLYIKHVDSDGLASPAVVYEFYAYPQ